MYKLSIDVWSFYEQKDSSPCFSFVFYIFNNRFFLLIHLMLENRSEFFLYLMRCFRVYMNSNQNKRNSLIFKECIKNIKTAWITFNNRLYFSDFNYCSSSNPWFTYEKQRITPNYNFHFFLMKLKSDSILQLIY